MTRSYYLRSDQIDSTVDGKYPVGSKEHQDAFDRTVMGCLSDSIDITSMSGTEFLTLTNRWSPKEIDVLEVLDLYLQDFERHHRAGNSIMLCGVASPIAHSAISNAAVSYLLDNSDDINCMILSSRDLIRFTNSAQFGKEDLAISASLDVALSADLLVLDKIGLEGISSDNSDSVIYDAITRRIALSLPVVLIASSPLVKRNGSNTQPLSQRFGEQFVSDLAIKCRIFDMKSVALASGAAKSKGRAW